MKTNQQVYDALTDCIENRWKKHARARHGVALNVPPCALCKLFDGGIMSFRDGTGGAVSMPAPGCHACPLYLTNGFRGCAGGTAFSIWATGPTKRRAAKMLAELETAKVHFFGDWTK